MRFIEDDVKTGRFGGCCILNGLPDGVIAPVTCFGEQVVFAEFLSIQEIDFARFKAFLTERRFDLDQPAFRERYWIALDLVVTLRVQFRGITDP
jgi:hypothetical protein